MENEPLEETYFNWLYKKVAYVMNPTPSLTFYTLLRDLHNVEFLWMLVGDDNRAQDGLDIRKEFFRESFLKPNEYWSNIGCSFFEMLYALSRRAEFNTDISAKDWFWIFLNNLNLSKLNDASVNITSRANKIIDKVIWREYEPNGEGGIFPLVYPNEDQRNVEIWFQLHAYINENDLF